MGKETIETLLSVGLITDIEDIFNLQYDDLIELPQWEDKKASNLINSIKKSTKSQPSRLLTALGIRFVGNRTANLLIQNFGSIDKILEATSEELENIHGISGSVINSLNDWKVQEKNIKTLSALKDAGFSFTEEKKATLSKLTGQTFVITGTLEKFNRQEFISLIENNGGSVTTSISKNTNFLISGTNPGSKLNKAQDLGVKVITEEDLLGLIS
jgi:DNA ligase (NAD+)